MVRCTPGDDIERRARIHAGAREDPYGEGSTVARRDVVVDEVVRQGPLMGASESGE
jgi:hypothetical protein